MKIVNTHKIKKNQSACAIFLKLSMLNITFGAGTIGTRAGAASRYSSGSTKMMRLLAAPAPQHWSV
jgi:hypothetical protein